MGVMTESFKYLILYKPYDVLTAFTDPEGHRTLSAFVNVPDVYAVGRLDLDSEGLLLLTNDGRLAHKLTDPSFEHTKTYWVQVEGEATEAALDTLRRGVEIKGGYLTRPCQASVIPEPVLPPRSKPITPHGATAWLEIMLTEGKKRQIRHMTAAVGLPTLRLVRAAIGPLRLENLQPGEWRFLTLAEIRMIQSFTRSRRPK